MEALILVATSGGPTMFARIGVMRALDRHVERVFNPDRKERHWGRRKLARDRYDRPSGVRFGAKSAISAAALSRPLRRSRRLHPHPRVHDCGVFQRRPFKCGSA